MRRTVLTLAAAAVLLWTLPAQAKETVRRFAKQIPTDGVSLVDLDFSVGQYSTASTSVNGSSSSSNSSSGDIKDKAIHEWLTIGAKVTFWP